MSARQVRVGSILRMDRERIEVELTSEYRQIGIYSWGKGIIEREAMPGSELSKLNYYKIPTDALVLSNIQAWEAAIAIATSKHSDFIASQRFLPYVPIRKNEVDLQYLLEFFLSDPGMALIRKASPGSVTRNRTLGIKAFEDLRVPLPDIDRQRAIAQDLKSAASVAEARRRDTTQFHGALREQFLATIAHCPRKSLRDLVTPATTAITVHSEMSYPNIGLLNRGRGVFAKPDVRGDETKYTRLFPVQTGQLIYSKLFGWEGSVAIVPERFDGHFVSSEFPRFDVGTAVDLGYLAQAIRSQSFAQQLATATTGMGQRRQRVNIEQFLGLSVPVPERLDDQRRVASQLERLDAATTLIDQQSTVSNALPKAARNEIFAELTR